MLSDDQRARILAGLTPTTLLPIKPLASGYESCWVPEPPDVSFEVTSQGVRQACFMDNLWDHFDGFTWIEKRGHISRATIQLTIEMMDTRALEVEAYSLYNKLWGTEAGIGRGESPEGDYLLFKGCDPPKFMPPYVEDPTFPYRAVIEYWVDYFDTFTLEIPPILEVGVVMDELETLTITWPETFYLLDAIFE
jgi:hypothetical protein